jgi:hypothetical protein
VTVGGQLSHKSAILGGRIPYLKESAAMRKIVWSLGALALIASPAAAQAAKPAPQTVKPAILTADRSAADSTLIANEHKIINAILKGDKATFVSMFAPDGWLADNSGFMKGSDLVAGFDQLKMTSATLSDEKVIWLGANSAIVTSTWTGAGSFQGQAFAPKSYCSTGWTKRNGTWIAVYHQESAAAEK